MLQEAESVIKEFEEVVSEDVELYSIKEVLHIYKNEIQEALYVVKEGLLLDSKTWVRYIKDLFIDLSCES